ncbi:hypothetical protein GIB67_034162 [Kingdonia uniflora]|uniref:Condensin complex subunit 1 C-terminal domain-containing protein n=1 Tax=Kingdonia uniflora TaxID=39325 RepID=A0A7J7LS69_9MAGN|nr:hypothetical protein GIB67_034162 [Kingdonia uniflora]
MSGVTAEQSRGALSVLCMTAKSSTGVLGPHLQDIIDIGFGRWAKEEPLLARTACIALQRLSKEDKEKMMVNNGNWVFGILQSLITGFSLPENIWYAATDKAITAIYAVHPTPETLAADVVKTSLRSVFAFSTLRNELPIETLSPVQVTKLSRYLFVVGHVALNQLVYIKSCLRKIQKQKTRKERSELQSQEVQSNYTTQADVPTKEMDINAELGIVSSEDAILDTLSERAEKEIISSSFVEKNLIGQCAPFLSKLCRNLGLMHKYPELQASGMLALCRFMLLFTVVESSSSEVVRSNCTIALGDLAVRFPNLLEPWTENIYARLRDSSISVRKNAVLVLSHLILNDMMKVKGYINEMAVRVEDEEERISSLAKLFFHELSKKGSNPIYNLLPDILGRLSNQNLKKEVFSNIMQFLISSIKKDKQMESLVEKLCNRFSGVTDVKQWECIAYCLSQLTFTEKGIKKLIESFKSYEHVLSEDSVMDNFKNIITKGKKFARPELKFSIEEFEEKLNKFHMEKKEQEITARNAQVHQQNRSTLEGLMESKDDSEEKVVKVGTAEDGELSNSSMEDGTTQILNDKSEASSLQSEESTDTSSSVLTDCEAGRMKVQSSKLPRTGTLKSKAKKISSTTGKENAPRRSKTKGTRRLYDGQTASVGKT